MQPNLLHGVWIAEEGGTFNHNFLLSTSLLFLSLFSFFLCPLLNHVLSREKEVCKTF